MKACSTFSSRVSMREGCPGCCVFTARWAVSPRALPKVGLRREHARSGEIASPRLGSRCDELPARTRADDLGELLGIERADAGPERGTRQEVDVRRDGVDRSCLVLEPQ